jgi:signal transduction histidine kinase
VLWASPAQLAQIEAWVAAFRKVRATVEAVSEIGLERFDLYFVAVELGAEEAGAAAPKAAGRVDDEALGSVVVQAAFTPCVVLGTEDDEALIDAALKAGAADFLALPTLDAIQVERAVQFSMGRRRVINALTARETCLAAARERDRQQLANELHDGPLQDLIGARFLLGALTPGGSTDDIQSSIQQVIQQVRALCSDLKPPALGPFGLEKAIRAHMQSFRTRHPEVQVTLELDVEQPQLPEWVRLALYRIFQAALSNVTRHAQAAHVWVRLVIDEAQMRLTVADDGLGFELPSSWLEFARTERCGLLMMQERVDALQGRMVVQSSLGGGTRVMVQVPLDQPTLPLPAYLASTEPARNG